ncbi:lipoprotein-releasing system transmembrane subunit LolC [Oceanidesulfovibrio indonesiensis]|uniref:Lipoprotein-releasing system transmembrane subunit LolC n=1 Tax=Oceanidesulfovibrio indonesiensis TaxID=54767 RepID=A0A7M3ME89_9BACT|nr:ABC transporter permease [Oceanidesulfovibrio indonesiensis]TVM17140.1 lipoprotein-releasing system transmembrane subunit LolC [Oceanidesulfovibrio indonesiensis]
MRFPLFIALRYLSTRKRSFLSIISLVSVAGVALGVAALIVVTGVMNGFSTELREKMLGITSHIVVTPRQGAFDDYEPALRAIRDVGGVEAATPFIKAEVMLSSGRAVKGVALRGVDPGTADNVLTVDQHVEAGIGLAGLDEFRHGQPVILMGRELADRLRIALGSSLELLSPSGRSSSAGFAPKEASFVMAGAFRTGMYEYDSVRVYVSLDAARSLLGFRDGSATGIEVRCNDVFEADRVALRIAEALGQERFEVRHWKEMNANLFAALELEKTGLSIIMVMIVIVGSFSIVAALVMLVMEKTRDIAILVAMGARRRQVKQVFMMLGMLVGGFGAVTGLALGLAASWVVQKYKIIKLPEGVYPLSHLPIRIEILDLGIVMAAAFLLCYLATMYPSRHAARLDPAEILRFE